MRVEKGLFWAGVGILAALSTLGGQALAAEPASVERLYPPTTLAFIEVVQAKEILNAPELREAYETAVASGQLQQVLDSPDFQRFREGVRFFETQLGVDWREGLERLTGGGITIGLEPGPPPRVTGIVQSQDAAFLGRFHALLLEAIRSEQTRKGGEAKIEESEHRGVKGYKTGPDQYHAVVGDKLVFSNHLDTLKKVVDRLKGDGGASLADDGGLKAARKLLPRNATARGYVNLKPIKMIPQVQEALALPSKNAALGLALGGWLDLGRRADFVAAALVHEADGWSLSVRLPAGSEGMAEAVRGFFAPASGAGAAPLLKPTGVLASVSWYLDLAGIWKAREKLADEEQLKFLTEADQRAGGLVGAKGIRGVLEMIGPRTRLVVARQRDSGYKTKPSVRLPGAAAVIELAQADAFMQTVPPLVRTAAGAGAAAAGLVLEEEKYKDAALTTWRFREDGAQGFFTNPIRFNFSPGYARVGNYFVVASTTELIRDLADTLASREGSEAPTPAGTSLLAEVYLEGLADYVGDLREVLETQNMLAGGRTPAEAAGQIELARKLVRSMGRLRGSITLEKEQLRADLRLVREEKKSQ